MTAPAAPPAAPAPLLVRGIRRWDLVALVINAVIGAGIFGLPARAYALAGPWSLLAFVVCAAVTMLIVLCFAELGSRFERTGGPYLYVEAAFGPRAAFTIGWLTWLARVTAFAALCNLLIGYLGHFWPGAAAPGPRALVIAAVVAALAAINLRGIRQAALVSDAFTVGKLVPLVVFVAVGLFAVEPARLSLAGAEGGARIREAALLLIFAFTGFETATIPSGEARAPRRDLPFALLTAMAAVTVVYLGVQTVCVGTLPGLATSERPLAEAARVFMGPAGAALVAAGALVSITGTLNSIMIAGPRLPFAMALAGQLPRALGSAHPRFHTPHVAILLTAAVVLVLTVQGSFIGAVTISTVIRLVTYAMTCAALPTLRWRERRAGLDGMRLADGAGVGAAEFRLRAGGFVALLALGLCAWLLTSIAWREARDAALAALLGLALHGLYRGWVRVRAARGGASGAGP